MPSKRGRVLDPQLKALLDSPTAQIDCGDLPDPSGLLRWIVSEPDENTHRLVYADWLEENDQPSRANYVRSSAREPECVVLVAQNESPEWAEFPPRLRPFWWNERANGRGFLLSIECNYADWIEHGDAVRAREWVPRVDLLGDAHMAMGGIGPDGATRIGTKGDPKKKWFSADDVVRMNEYDPEFRNMGSHYSAHWGLRVLRLRYPGTLFFRRPAG